MSTPFIQPSFTAGELAPALFGRVDFNKYNIGASTLRNFYVNYRGGANSRAGTAFVGFSKQSQGAVATGNIYFATNPSPGDTATLNGVVWEFVSGSPIGNQVQIQGTTALTIDELAIALTASSNPALTVANYTYSSSGGSTAYLIVTYNNYGAQGNAYTLAASAGTPSGANLTGGLSQSVNPPRLIPFQFSLLQGLMLEFGNEYMRVISEGAYVTEASVNITGVTKASPAVVTATIGSLASGDSVYIASVGGMTQLNGRTFVVMPLTSGSFALYDIFGQPINSTSYGTYTSGGTAARIYTLTTPYLDDDILFLKVTQSADVMSICCVNQTTGTEYPAYELARIADNNWTLTVLNTGASIGPPTAVSATASNTDSGGTGYPTNYAAVVTAIDASTGQESVASNIVQATDSVDISATSGAITYLWDILAGAGYYNIYQAPPAVDTAVVPIGSLYGYIGTSYGNSFVNSNIVADLTQVPPLHSNPFARGQLIGVTITSPGSSLIGPVNGTITTSTGSGAEGYGILSGTSGSATMVGWVWTSPGENYANTDTITFFDAGGDAATGTATFSGLPNPGDTLTLNGAVFTFVASGGTPHNYEINSVGSVGGMLTIFQSELSTSSTYLTDARLNVATYANTSSELIVTYKTPGTAGNAYTFVASSGSISLTGSGTLTGGTGGTVPTGTLILGAQSGTYPGTVAYFQERRVYGYTLNQPDTYFMSQPGAYTNYDSRVPTIDSDAVIGSPWSVAVDGIQFMVPLLGSLAVLTGQAIYLVGGNGSSPTAPQPITPSSQQALPQMSNGCHYHVAPVKIDYDIYFLQAKGSIIRAMAYNFWINVANSIDVTYLSSHLFTGYSIDAIAWCEEPYKILWCVRNDGALLSLTTLKTQDVMGWARHDTQGAFVAAASIIESPVNTALVDVVPNVDALYLAVYRSTSEGTAYYIERMDDRFWSTVEQAWCVDCALELPQTFPNAIIVIGVTQSQFGLPNGFTNLIGGKGYSDATVMAIKDPTGTGITVTPTLSGAGAVTNIAFGGSLTASYMNPVFTIEDPQGLGSGFSADVQITNTVTVFANSAVFNSGMVGWVIRAGNGVIQITSYASTSEVTGQLVGPLIPLLTGGFPSGQWSLTEPVTTITGLDHLNGLDVTGLADGNVIPLTTVVNGSITLSNAASAVIVGLPFTPQLQTLYLDSGQPTQQGARKKIGAATVRVEASGSFSVGSNQVDTSTLSPPLTGPQNSDTEGQWPSLTPAPTSSTGLATPAYGTAEIAGTTIMRPVALWTGDIRVLPPSGYEKPGQIAVEQPNPLPLNVLAIVREDQEGDTPQSWSKIGQQQGRGAQQ